MLKILKGLIKIYQRIVPKTRTCRFYPSCSQYMYQAVDKYGYKGVLLGIKRILKCHPFNPGGYDPI